jgi:acetyl esterase/lipase
MTIAEVAADTPLADVMSAPEFHGFSELIFPYSDRITGDMSVSDTARLLPYHSNIEPAEVAATLNALRTGVQEQDVTFLPVYSDDEIASDPAKAAVGLFFLRGETGAPFGIVSPGGGFSYVASIHEGFPYAQAISAHGYNAFVLNYRVGGGGRPALEDLAHAIDYLFEHADILGVNTEGYSLWGSSAGARMAAYLGSYGSTAFGAADWPRAITVIMAYTGHTDYTEGDPATFAVVGSNDAIASPLVMEERIRHLERAGIDVQFRRYEGIGHGFGLGTGTVAEGWIDEAVRFWETQLNPF